MPTQREIAEILGISQRTVSEAFKENGKIREQTRRKILETAARIGYFPNSAAQAARTGKFGAAGFLFPNTAEGVFLPLGMVRGAIRRLNEANMHMVIDQLAPTSLGKAEELPRILRHMAVDGLLINIFHAIPPEAKHAIEVQRIPSIWLNSRQEYDCVFPDDYAHGRMAAEYLLDHGHRRIAFLRFDSSMNEQSIHRHYSVRDRIDGYTDAMQQAGLSPRLIEVPWIRWAQCFTPNKDERLKYLVPIFASVDRPTAIIGYGFREVESAVVAALCAGLKIPDDLSLIGFHDDFIENAGFSIDTVKLPFSEVGVKAAELLIQKIDQPHLKFPEIPIRGRILPGCTVRNLG
ncbi:MAG: LacI family transcriptional regulator [Lentisphaerae bacterium]|nr:MAG: LacI family transcriptional regulator [Lentisphaerota bacterium]